MARAKYVRGTKAERIRKILGTLPPEQLNDGPTVMEAVKKAGIVATSSEVYGYRKQIREGNGGSTNGSVDSFVPSLDQLGVVSKAANKVGGLHNLKSAIEYIEKIKSIS